MLRGAADVGATPVQLVLQGKRSQRVTITDIHALILKRAAPLTGTLLHCPSAGEGAQIPIGLNLDELDSVARFTNADGSLGNPYFAKNYVTLEKNEVITFEIAAETTSSYCEWNLRLDLLVDGQRQTMTIRAGDQPFRTTVKAGHYRAAFEWAWYLSPHRFAAPTVSGP
jgi:hypothetical protein